MNLTKDQIGKIQDYALAYFNTRDSLHGRQHAIRSIKLAELIASKEGAKPGMAKIGALVREFNEEPFILDDFLHSLDIDDETHKKLMAFPNFHADKGMKTDSMEVKVVYDAAKLQTLGPLGILRFVPDAFDKHKDLLKTVETVRKAQDETMRSLQTHTAQEMAKAHHKLAMLFFDALLKQDKADY